MCLGDNTLVVFGGGVEVRDEQGDAQWLGSTAVWTFRFADASQQRGTWAQVQTTFGAPSLNERFAREETSAVLLGARLVVFHQKHIVVLQPALTAWHLSNTSTAFSWLSVSNATADEFEKFSVTALNDTHAIVVGGVGTFDNVKQSAPTFLVEVPSNGGAAVWTELSSSAATAALPIGAHGAVLVPAHDVVFTFGGALELDSQPAVSNLAILRRLSVSTGVSTVVPISNTTWPPPMHDARLTLLSCGTDATHALLLFGGSVKQGNWLGRAFTAEGYGGTWVYDFGACPNNCTGGAGGSCDGLGVCRCRAPNTNSVDALPFATPDDQAVRLLKLTAPLSGWSLAPNCSSAAAIGEPAFWSPLAVGLVAAVAVGFALGAIGVVVLLVVRAQRRRHAHLLAPLQAVPSVVGAEIAAKFSIDSGDLVRESKIGEGSFGVVWRGTFRLAPAAIKEIKASADVDEGALLREADVLQALRPHPNVVAFFGVARVPLALVFEFIALGSLEAALYGDDAGKLIAFTREQQAAIECDIARGVAHLHAERIVHRDLAARNVLLQHLQGDVYVAKITDFGLARGVADAGPAAAGVTVSHVGPVKWMAPEQMRSLLYSSKSDMFAFGVTLWEIEARSAPWRDETNLVAAQRVLSGERLAFPVGTHDTVVATAARCFSEKPDDRPTATRVVRRFQQSFGVDLAPILVEGAGAGVVLADYSAMPTAPVNSQHEFASARFDDGAVYDSVPPTHSSYSSVPVAPAIEDSQSSEAEPAVPLSPAPP